MSETPPCSPRNNGHLQGHEAAEAQFLQAWNSQRLAHAWLITGPRGVGKATLAYRMARFVLSGGGEGGGLFGGAPDTLALSEDHAVFRRIASGGLTDLRVVERGFSDDKQTKLRSEIVVDDVRGVGSFLSLTSAEGGWRVVLVDAADEMNRNAANALLKVLEEPPARALLLLVSHAPGSLLPTIRSRCRSLPLSPLDDAGVDSLLTRYRPEINPEDRRILVALAEGSPGRALALEEQGGLELYRDLIRLLASLPRLDIPALHDFAEKVGRGADSFRAAGELLLWWLARLIRARGRGEAAPIALVVGEGEVMARLGGLGSLDQWVEVWENITQSFARAEAINLDRKQVMLTAFSALESVVART